MQTSMTYNETVDFICAVGTEVTPIVEGHIGSGKSSLIHAIGKRFPNHRKVYMDMTVMHEGDFRIPAVNHESKTTEFYYNESFGLHDDVPVVLMLDEMVSPHALCSMRLYPCSLKDVRATSTCTPSHSCLAQPTLVLRTWVTSCNHTTATACRLYVWPSKRLTSG